ncbi:MAG TPA: oligosaccharide flippase family protein [Ideonella sp.]|jgi:O-antigen/teichoic acid export membrane protein|nr:oligosaccharide flippase family protein [Ideonella sp.]
MPPTDTPEAANPVASLRRRAGSAAVWIGVGFALTQAVRLGSSIVLTRLLAPEMYGLMSMGTVVISAVVMMSDFGFSQSVIHNPRGDDPRFLNTIWTLQMLRGFALCLLMNLAALGLLAAHAWAPDWLGGSYSDPNLPAVVAILSLVPIAMALESTNLARAQRALSMGRVVRNEVLVQLGVTTLMIVLATHWPSYWVLPLGWVVFAGGVTLLSHLTLPGPPNRLGWDREAATSAWHFSKWILLSSLLTYLFREGDRILLGGMLSSAELGIYAVGALLVGATREVIYRLSAFVGMPALAEVAREQPQRLREAYRQCRWPIDIVCLLAAGFLFSASDRIIKVIYDGRYGAAGHTLAVLSLGLIAFRYTVMDQYLIATGETRQLFKRGVIQILTMYSAVPIGFSLGGTTGALIGILLAQSAVVPFMLKVQHDRGLMDWRFEIGTLAIFPVGWALGWALR